MKITVTLKPNSRKESIESLENGELVVRVNAPPVDGRANERAIELIAKHYGVAKSRVSLEHGGKIRRKVFSVALDPNLP